MPKSVEAWQMNLMRSKLQKTIENGAPVLLNLSETEAWLLLRVMSGIIDHHNAEGKK